MSREESRSVEPLKRAGSNDPLWLEIVRGHPRPIDEGERDDPSALPQRLPELLQRISVFTVKLSRRKVRKDRQRDAALTTADSLKLRIFAAASGESAEVT